MISIKNLHKSYTDSSAKQIVFENASYEFNSHGVYSVVGSSGSGKTTLLNLISGLDVFDKGSIEINGKNLDTLSIEAKSALRKVDFGFGYQFHYLLENLTIHENCIAACNAQDNSHIASILNKLDIDHIKNKFPSKVSGGEKQRASIARALAKQPKILILDEPTGNLDHENSLIVQNFLLNYASENKSLVIYATHDIAFAKRADKSLNIVERSILEK